MNDQQQPEDLMKKRDSFRTRIYMLMIEVIFIFGIPAAIGLLAGKKLDAHHSTGNTITLSILACTFILSWIVVVVKYRKASRELKKINEQIAESKKQQ